MRDNTSTYHLSILVGGKPIHEYEHQGNTFVEGRKSSEFELEFKNNSQKRVLVIPSVDGLSTLDGKPATPESKGYIVQAWGTLRIPGWTIDGQSVAKFLFQDKERSYVSQSGNGSSANAGVIGVIVYEEEAPVQIAVPADFSTPKTPWNVPPFPPATLVGSSIARATTLTSNTVTPEPDKFSMGTGWGERQEFKVNQVKFNRGPLVAQMVIFYDSRRNLEKRGIQVVRRERTYLNDLPQAFSGLGCTPPPGWKG